MILEFLYKIFELADALNEPLGIEYGALDRVIGHSILLCKLEELEFLSHLLQFQVQILHLHRHRLVIIDQRSLFLRIQTDLLDQVFSRSSLVSLLLTEGKSFVRLDELPLRVYYDSLELISLSDQLLAIGIYLLLQLQVLLQKRVPLALTMSLAPLVLINQFAQLA